MITYLHHTDPNLPHYRHPEWNFQRGAAATVDRNFLGWMGRFFLHDVAHYHVIHHFFPKMPFCECAVPCACFRVALSPVDAGRRETNCSWQLQTTAPRRLNT